MKKLLIFLITGIATQLTYAQVESHINWAYAAKKTAATDANVLLKASLDEGWHIYAVNEDAPIKTKIKFAPSASYKTVGNIIEPKPISTYNADAKMKLTYFEKSVKFQQKVKLTGKKASVKGTLDYVVCNDYKCLPPESIQFTVPIAL